MSSSFAKEALAMAHNPDALDKTLQDVDAQLGDARDRGDFAMASRLGERRQAYLGYRQTLRNF